MVVADSAVKSEHTSIISLEATWTLRWVLAHATASQAVTLRARDEVGLIVLVLWLQTKWAQLCRYLKLQTKWA